VKVYSGNVANLRGTYKPRNFLSSWDPMDFSRTPVWAYFSRPRRFCNHINHGL